MPPGDGERDALEVRQSERDPPRGTGLLQGRIDHSGHAAVDRAQRVR